MANRFDITVIPLDADLDVTTAPLLRLALDQLVRAGCKRVIVNMAEAHYVDTAGMGVLVAASRRFREAGGLLSLINASAQVVHALRVGCLIDFIPVRALCSPVPELDSSAFPQWQRTLRVSNNDIAGLRRRFAGLLCDVSLTQDEAFDLTLACGEAVGNAVDHTRGEGVLVTVTCYADRVMVQVADNGDGYELAAHEVPEQTEERGRGVLLMRMLVDSVDIRCKAHGHGTVVTLVKLIDTGA